MDKSFVAEMLWVYMGRCCNVIHQGFVNLKILPIALIVLAAHDHHVKFVLNLDVDLAVRTH